MVLWFRKSNLELKMKKLHRTSAEIRRQLADFEMVMAPRAAPLPDDFASQAQILADRWHWEDLRRELDASLESEASAARHRRKSARKPALS